MSRNSEVVFSDLPQVNIPRSVMDIPQDIKTTFNVGKLIPFYVNECIPGSSVKINTHKVIRLQTLLTPLMDPLYLDTFYFFVPNRLVFDKFREFMGENTTGAYLPAVEYEIPRCYIGSTVSGADNSAKTGQIPDYMGVPLIPADSSFKWAINELPLRGYCLIWNEFFRDQNLQSPINFPLGAVDHDWKDFPVHDPLPVNRYHDYFSSALIAPAKFTSGFVSAWTSMAKKTSSNPLDSGFKAPVYAGSSSFSLYGHLNSLKGINHTAGGDTSGSFGVDSGSVVFNTDSPISNFGISPSNLYTDLMGNQFGITIPSLRQAFQLQKFLERDASHGTRYQEQLLAHFGVKAQDSRLQRPEYLGGNRIPLNINQIVNQASSSGEFLGDVGGMSLTADSHFDVEYSIQEHGFIIGLFAVRYKASYSQGLERFWRKFRKFDYAFPEFAHLTDQPVYSEEIYLDKSDQVYNDSVFGYQERYAEYKFKPNKVCAEMRPGISNSLAAWHLGDYYNNKVYFSDQWLQVDKANVDRALTVTSAVANQIFADVVVQARWTLPLPVHSNPGFADHF